MLPITAGIAGGRGQQQQRREQRPGPGDPSRPCHQAPGMRIDFIPFLQVEGFLGSSTNPCQHDIIQLAEHFVGFWCQPILSKHPVVQVTTGLADQQFECDSNSSSGAGSGQEKEEAGRVWQVQPGQQAAQYQARPSNGHQEQVLYTHSIPLL